VFEQKAAEFEAQGMTRKEAEVKAKPLSYSRTESKEEGLVRYAVIAEAVSDTSRNMNYHMCAKQCVQMKKEAKKCKPLACREPVCEPDPVCPDEKAIEACYKSCRKTSPWRWRRMEAIYSVLTIFSKESGFRADVHGGTGSHGLGDCAWKYPDTHPTKGGKRAAAWAKGANPVKKTCRSFCMGQINLGPKGKTRRGLSGADLVGIDLASTARCVEQTLRELSRSRLTCRKHEDWAGAMFSAYGTGWSCTNPKLVARSGAFWKHFNHPRALTQNWHDLLSEGRLEVVRQALRTSQGQLFFVSPIGPKTELEKTIAKVIGDPNDGKLILSAFEEEPESE
jgi:hypothetical protein